MYSLKDFGSFYLPGKYISSESNYSITYDVVKNYQPYFLTTPNPTYHYTVEQAYVQYFIPENSIKKPPVILVHGGGQTGSVWENTPDGRKGWLHYLLEAGYSCYILDNVERGRAGWCSIPDYWEGMAELRSAEETWELFRIGKSEDFSAHKAFDTQQFPVESFKNLLHYTVPRWRCNHESSTRAISQLLNKIGPSILLSHCQSGIFAFNSAMQNPELIKSLILMEPPALPPEENISQLSVQGKNILFVYGDFIEEQGFWYENFKETKTLCDYLKRLGAKSNILHLPEAGLRGNSHMMQMDKNNDKVLEIILHNLSE